MRKGGRGKKRKLSLLPLQRVLQIDDIVLQVDEGKPRAGGGSGGRGGEGSSGGASGAAAATARGTAAATGAAAVEAARRSTRAAGKRLAGAFYIVFSFRFGEAICRSTGGKRERDERGGALVWGGYVHSCKPHLHPSPRRSYRRPGRGSAASRPSS